MKTEITENSHDIIGMIADTRKLIQKTLVSGNSLTTTQTRKYIYIYTYKVDKNNYRFRKKREPNVFNKSLTSFNSMVKGYVYFVLDWKINFQM